MTDIQTIRVRHSVRTYDPRPLDEETRAALLRALESCRKGPFGTEVELRLLDLGDPAQAEGRRMWTYGVIKGARSFLAGAIFPSPVSTLDYGYVMERAILQATRLGLGTCWLGGSFSRGTFAQGLGLREGQVIPAVSPVGFPSDRRTIVDRAMKLLARSKDRKPWSSLFFASDGRTPLTEGAAGKYAEALECVRLGPSASNGQPWRVFAEAGNAAFHFALVRKRTIDHGVSAVSLQEIDLGIALCHFEGACRELELDGRWSRDGRPQLAEGAEYVATWLAS